MDLVVGDLLELAATRYPDRDALVHPYRKQRWTYAEVDAKVNRLANALANRGVGAGDRVSTVLHNGSEIVLVAFACAKLGAVFNPLSYRFPTDQLADVLAEVAPAALVFEGATREPVGDASEGLAIPESLYVGGEPPAYATSFDDAVAGATEDRPDADIGQGDAYDLLYTSGTTGRPKGVVHDHSDVIAHDHVFLAEGGVERTDVGLSAFPLYHAAEFHGGLLPRIHMGVPNIIHRGFDPARVLRAIETHGATVLFAPPVGWRALLEAQDGVEADPASLRLGLYGAASMPAEVLEGCLEAFDADFLQAYGATELGPCCTFLHADDRVEKRGSAGLPAINHELRIVEPGGEPDDELPRGEVGEIVVAGPATMREYWNRPAATADSLREADGREWYYTGDLGSFDPDGYLHVVDRTDDLIVSGGENVYPAEVEEPLCSHPGVRQAAVVGEPDDRWGERVVGYVEGEATAEELDRHLRADGSLPDFKRPRRYYFVEEIPTNANGKVRRVELREGEPGVEPEFPP